MGKGAWASGDRWRDGGTPAIGTVCWCDSFRSLSTAVNVVLRRERFLGGGNGSGNGSTGRAMNGGDPPASSSPARIGGPTTATTGGGSAPPRSYPSVVHLPRGG